MEENLVDLLYEILKDVDKEKAKENLREILDGLPQDKRLLEIIANGGAIVGKNFILGEDHYFNFNFNGTTWSMTGGSTALDLKPGKYRVTLIFERTGNIL